MLTLSSKSVDVDGLEAAKITLCASIWPSSQARVTSVNSLSSLRRPKALLTFSLKSFHFRQSFSDILTVCWRISDILMPLLKSTFHLWYSLIAFHISNDGIIIDTRKNPVPVYDETPYLSPFLISDVVWVWVIAVTARATGRSKFQNKCNSDKSKNAHKTQ